MTPRCEACGRFRPDPDRKPSRLLFHALMGLEMGLQGFSRAWKGLTPETDKPLRKRLTTALYRQTGSLEH